MRIAGRRLWFALFSLLLAGGTAFSGTVVEDDLAGLIGAWRATSIEIRDPAGRAASYDLARELAAEVRLSVTPSGVYELELVIPDMAEQRRTGRLAGAETRMALDAGVVFEVERAESGRLVLSAPIEHTFDAETAAREAVLRVELARESSRLAQR